MIKKVTPNLAYPKIKHYCGYSERCHADVRDKLYGYGLMKKEVELLLSRLIEENYLNETRFAVLFAGGHFRQKKWGKVKIAYALRQKRVSEANIKIALKEVKAADYTESLQKLALARWKSLKGEAYQNRQTKTIGFLARKGYEMNVIQEVLKKISAREVE